MRVKQIRLVLPPRMRANGAADARLIAQAVARELAKAPPQSAVPQITVQGLGRSAQHLRHDVIVATQHARNGALKGT